MNVDNFYITSAKCHKLGRLDVQCVRCNVYAVLTRCVIEQKVVQKR